jgi:hypothetical protein
MKYCDVYGQHCQKILLNSKGVLILLKIIGILTSLNLAYLIDHVEINEATL